MGGGPHFGDTYSCAYVYLIGNFVMKNGFTLLELLITLAIIGIVAAVGFPSLSQIIKNNRVSASVNSFIGTLSYARSEAIKRGTTITVNATNAETSNEWGAGWNIADGATVLKTFSDLGGSTLDSTNGLSQITFNSRGFLASADNLSLCNDEGDNCTSIIVFATGNARVNRNNCP